MEQQTQNKQFALRTKHGQQVLVGPEGAEAIRQEAVSRGIHILDEIRNVWAEFESADATPDRQQVNYLRRQLLTLPQILQTLQAFSMQDEYWAGDQQFGPR